MIRHLAVAVLLLGSMGAVAHADPVTFTFTDVTFDSGATLTGTIDIDTASGSFTAVNAVYTPSGGPGITLDELSGQANFPNPTPFTVTFLANSGGDGLTLSLPVADAIGYTGGSICSTAHPDCGIHSAFESSPEDKLSAGRLVGPSVVPAVPEPSSLILLGTGVLGAVGIVRRRLVA